MNRNIAVGLLGVALVSTSQAGIVNYTQDPVDGTILDNSSIGTALTISGGLTRVVTDVDVRLNIGAQATAAMWNGDIVAYLTHGSQTVTLLNRVGSGPGNAVGSGDNGFNITLDDAALNDIHNASAGGGILSGTFNADGAALLSDFNGSSVDGDWILSLYDQSSGGLAQVNSWGLDITYRDVSQVPDSSLGGIGFSAMLFGGLMAYARRRSWVHGH